MSDLLFEKIRSILIEHWDPVGIGPPENSDGAEDEYDSYARDLVRIVARGGDSRELEDYLAGAERHIGISRSPARLQEAARLLSQLAP